MLNDTDCIVVGAGYAGLVAARRLRQAGRSVIVLEARDRVGGRVHSVTTDAGVTLDLGGQWIGPTQDRIYALADEMGVETFPQYDDGDHLLQRGGELHRYPATARLPALPKPAMIDLGIAMVRLDRMARSVPTEAPWTARKALDWDAQTMHTWIERHIHTRAGRDLFRVAFEAVWATDPRDVSLLHALFYIHSGRGLEHLLGTTGGAQQDRIVGGAQAVADRLAADLGESVKLAAPVRSIAAGDSGVEVATDAGAFGADRVIVAVPPTLAGRIDYDPPLPADRDQLTQRLPQGSVIKLLAVYDRPFWRDDGLTGQSSSDAAAVGTTFDATPPDTAAGVLLGFAEANHARALQKMRPDERRRLFVDHAARLLGPRAADPVDFHELIWADEEWTRGCYAAFAAPGVLTQHGHALRPPIGRIHWAGTETATESAGYIDGAVRSGEHAAAEVVEATEAGAGAASAAHAD